MPNTPGDALRYMNDPQLGGDYDYYPTRYTGTSDNGGVHLLPVVHTCGEWPLWLSPASISLRLRLSFMPLMWHASRRAQTLLRLDIAQQMFMKFWLTSEDSC